MTDAKDTGSKDAGKKDAGGPAPRTLSLKKPMETGQVADLVLLGLMLATSAYAFYRAARWILEEDTDER